MTFGEKLKAIRKEKGYSQEEMAGLLDVSRQAVSKWESDRGIPEIDKLLKISNMFGVTLDYLLKNESPDENIQSGGYYVSRETIDGFLSYKRHRAKNIAIGMGLIIGSDIFGSFSDYRQLLLPCSNSLLFDEAIIKSFREDSSRNRKRYAGMIVLSVLLFFFGSEFIFMAKDIVGNEVCNALDWLMDAAAVMPLIMAGMSIHAENIIAQNKAYIHKKNSRGKYAWVYVALPATVLAVVMGIVTNAWSPVFPIIFLFCVLLVTVNLGPARR